MADISAVSTRFARDTVPAPKQNRSVAPKQNRSRHKDIPPGVPGDNISRFRMHCTNGDIEGAQKLFSIFGPLLLEDRVRLLSVICEKEHSKLVKWLLSVETFSTDELSHVLWTQCLRLSTCLEICELLADNGATININIMFHLRNPKTADWVIKRFAFDRQFVEDMRIEGCNYSVLDSAAHRGNFDLALWLLNEFSFPNLIISSLMVMKFTNVEHFFEFVEQYVLKYGTKVINNNAIDALILSSIELDRLDMTEKFVEIFQVDPRAYGIDPDFTDLGPKFAGKE